MSEIQVRSCLWEGRCGAAHDFIDFSTWLMCWNFIDFSTWLMSSSAGLYFLSWIGVVLYKLRELDMGHCFSLTVFHCSLCPFGFTIALGEIWATCFVLKLVLLWGFLLSLCTVVHCSKTPLLVFHAWQKCFYCVWSPLKQLLDWVLLSWYIESSNKVTVFHSNRPVPTFCYGNWESSEDTIGSAFCCWCMQQVLQFMSEFSSSVYIPGHHTNNLALLWHLLIPWCPAWILLRISFWRTYGITIWFSCMSNPLSTKSSEENAKYGFANDGIGRLSGQKVQQ